MSLTPEQKMEVMSLISQYGSNRRGLIKSYQPSPPMVQVQMMPPPADGSTQLSGWIPYKSWATGLQGSGWRVVAPPQMDQQVLLICEEADGKNYTAWGGYYSDVDGAPADAQPGEILFENETGAKLYLKAGGNIAMVTMVLDISAPGGGEAIVNINGKLYVSIETYTAGEAFTPHTHPYLPGGGPMTQTGPVVD